MLTPATLMSPTTRHATIQPVEPANREKPDRHRTFGQIVEEGANRDATEDIAGEVADLDLNLEAVLEPSGPGTDHSAERSNESMPMKLQSGPPAEWASTFLPQAQPGRLRAAELTGRNRVMNDAGLRGRHFHPAELRGMFTLPLEKPGTVEQVAIPASFPHASGSKPPGELNAAARDFRPHPENGSYLDRKGLFVIGGTGTDSGDGDAPLPETTNTPSRAFTAGPPLLWPHAQPSGSPDTLPHAGAEPHARRPDNESDVGLDALRFGAEAAIDAGFDDPAILPFSRDPDRAQPPAQAATRAEAMRSAAQQMSAAITARPDSGGVDIALNPEELGRVSMALRAGDDGVFLSIAAERPETMELMRRHILVLAAEFQELGYKNIAFEFETTADGAGGNSGKANCAPHDATTDPAETSSDSGAPKTNTPAGIDMRL